jgi:hypothetical protein
MTRTEYERYVACFNARDYDGLHEFFAEDVSLQTVGYDLRGKPAIRHFYDFFHSHVRETITLNHFLQGQEVDFAYVTIRFDGLKELTHERLAAEGFARMVPVPAAASVELDFFITYQSRGGKINTIRCAVFERPQ